MESKNLISQLSRLTDDDKGIIKAKIITVSDKNSYAKEVLENLTRDEALKTINWLKKRYNINE